MTREDNAQREFWELERAFAPSIQQNTDQQMHVGESVQCQRKSHPKKLEGTNTNAYTGPGIAYVPTGQTRKSHDSWGIC